MVYVLLTQNIQKQFKNKLLYGINKERLQFLIESQFTTVHNYELVLIARALELYNFEFEIKYSLKIQTV
jgi:hypothetical protein